MQIPFLRHISALAVESDIATVVLGFLGGFGLELVKINLSIAGVSFYKVFNEKQLTRELEQYEQTLLERNRKMLERIAQLRNQRQEERLEHRT